MTRVTSASVYPVVSLVLTQFCVIFAWVFFRADSFRTAAHMVGAMFGLVPTTGRSAEALIHLLLIASAYIFCVATPDVREIFETWNVGLVTYDNKRTWSIILLKWRPRAGWAVATAAILLIAVSVSLITGDISPFLYFQF